MKQTKPSKQKKDKRSTNVSDNRHEGKKYNTYSSFDHNILKLKLLNDYNNPNVTKKGIVKIMRLKKTTKQRKQESKKSNKRKNN